MNQVGHHSNVASLASLLGYGEKEFRRICSEAATFYKPFHLVTLKKDGITKKTRHIDNPSDKLALHGLQQAIKKHLLNPHYKLLDESLVGGIRKHNMMRHLEPHVGHATVVCMDLTNCFPNITRNRIYNVWRYHLGYSPETAKLLTKATTYRGYLPQGAPTSTMLCNFALSPMAEKIRLLLTAKNIAYTQYIDDLCFSGDDKAVRKAINEVYPIVYSFGQKINKSKTEIMDSKHHQASMGITVNKRTKVSPDYISKIIKRISIESVNGIVSSGAKLSIAGQIVHVKNYDHNEGKRLEKMFDERIKETYELTIRKKNDGVVKPCWQYKIDKTHSLKCNYLKN